MSKAPQTLTEEASNSGVGASQEFQQIGPSKQSNQIIALASVLVAVGLFASGRLETLVGPGLNQLTANAIPYEEVHILLSPSSVITDVTIVHTLEMCSLYVVPTWIGDLRTQKFFGD
jgi:hypothetical protein